MTDIFDGNLMFRPLGAGSYDVFDINYSVRIGTIHKVEGPGWILDDLGTTFFDTSQLDKLARFMEKLNDV